MSLEKVLRKARDTLLSFPRSTMIRVISHYDADGVTSAAILCKSLYRKGYDFHATLLKHPFRKELERILEEENEIVIFSDMGSGQVDLIEKFDGKVIIIDHHQPRGRPKKESTIFVNSNEYGIDGNYEISGAGLSYLFARVMDKENVDLSYLAISGAIGDKQHLGGFSGLNREILKEAVRNRIVKIEGARMKITGSTMLEELTESIDPYYFGLSGNEEMARKLLKNASIDPEKAYAELSEDEKKKLHSMLVLRLMKCKVQPEVLENFIGKRYVTSSLQDDLERFADVLDACGKMGETGIALATCMDIEKFYGRAKSIEYNYRKIILKKLIELEKDGLKEKDRLIYFKSEEASIGSCISSIVMNYFPYKEKPVFSITEKEDEIQVSCRATRELVERGLDLGKVMSNIANKLGRSDGGGHKIAAGGSFRGVELERLIDMIDEEIRRQIG